MRKGAFYILIAIISIAIIALNTVDSVKYLTCEDPDNYSVTIDEMTDDEITVTIQKITQDETYSDNVYHIEDGVLYIGVKFTMNPLNDNPDATHTITIELEEAIHTIIAKGGIEEKTIYPE